MRAGKVWQPPVRKPATVNGGILYAVGAAENAYLYPKHAGLGRQVTPVPCDRHPALFAGPAGIACPWCAQEARQAAYARQRQDWERTKAEAVQRLPRPSSEPLAEAAD